MRDNVKHTVTVMFARLKLSAILPILCTKG